MDRLVVTDNAGVIVVAGEVDAETSHAMNEAIARTDGDIVVDLAGCTFMDSTGVSALVAADQLAGSRGSSLSLVEPSSVVLRLLEVCGMIDTFAISPGPPTPS